MGRLVHCLTSALVGAVAMYYLDPDMGRRRRALACDQMESKRRHANRYARKVSKRASNRLHGLTAKVRGGMPAPESDRQLEERLRARLGHVISHPRAVELVVNQGEVALTGNILTADHSRLLGEISRMAGVKAVDDRLQTHEEAGTIPQLQGQPHAGGRPSSATSSASAQQDLSGTASPTGV